MFVTRHLFHPSRFSSITNLICNRAFLSAEWVLKISYPDPLFSKFWCLFPFLAPSSEQGWWDIAKQDRYLEVPSLIVIQEENQGKLENNNICQRGPNQTNNMEYKCLLVFSIQKCSFISFIHINSYTSQYSIVI